MIRQAVNKMSPFYVEGDSAHLQTCPPNLHWGVEIYLETQDYRVGAGFC